MSARPVQISMDTELLRRIDADPEVQRRGRSAFVRSALRFYLRAKERTEIDSAICRAYGGEADHLAEEIDDLMEMQAWPDER